jgi:hypothetical protein
MERLRASDERVTLLPERALTGPLFTVGTQFTQSNVAITGGNTCFAGCPTIIVQFNVATVIQLAFARGGRGGRSS